MAARFKFSVLVNQQDKSTTPTAAVIVRKHQLPQCVSGAMTAIQIVSNYPKPKICTGKFYFIVLKSDILKLHPVKFDGFSSHRGTTVQTVNPCIRKQKLPV